MKQVWAANILFVCLLLPLAASAQSKTESVTVTGQIQKARTEILRRFIQSTVALSYVDRKLTRWSQPLCPLVIGLKPEENAAVAERIRKDAQSVGAQVAANQPCAPNVTVAFAPDPQMLMTKIAESADKKGYLGDNDGAYQRRKLSHVVAPIQAWYGTMTTQKHRAVAAKGVPYKDVADFCQLARCVITQASRLGDGVPSNLAKFLS